MERTGLWSRIGQWFQGGTNADHETPPADDRFAPGRAADLGPPDEDQNHGEPSRWGRLGRLSARQADLEQVQSQLRELTQGLNEHLRDQSQQFAAAGQSLGEIREALKEITAVVEAHRGLLERTAGRMDDQAGCARRSEQSLANLPQIAESQRALTAALTQHLELSRKMSEQAAATLKRLQDALGSIGESVHASTESIRDLRREGLARQDELTAVARETARRLTWAAGAVIGLLALTAAACWTAVFL